MDEWTERIEKLANEWAEKIEKLAGELAGQLASLGKPDGQDLSDLEEALAHLRTAADIFLETADTEEPADTPSANIDLLAASNIKDLFRRFVKETKKGIDNSPDSDEP